MAQEIDWVDGLADDTWRAIAASLGLYALSLRRTCASFHRRVLALAELPVPTQLARLAVQFLDEWWSAPWDREVQEVNGSRHRLLCTEHQLKGKMLAASHRDLFGMIDALIIVNESTAWTKRPLSRIVTQMKQHHSLWEVFTMRARGVGKLERDWNGHKLSDDELVCALRRFVSARLVAPGALFLESSKPCGYSYSSSEYTTLWHLAAARANLKVLAFLWAECSHPVHARTPGGNNALAHARSAHARARLLYSALDDSEKLAQTEARYAPVFAFLLHLGLDDKPFSYDDGQGADVDESSDSEGSAMDMLDVALGAQMSAQ